GGIRAVVAAGAALRRAAVRLLARRRGDAASGTHPRGSAERATPDGPHPGRVQIRRGHPARRENNERLPFNSPLILSLSKDERLAQDERCQRRSYSLSSVSVSTSSDT